MIVLAGLGLTGLWVAVFAAPGSISGGLPLLPGKVNDTIARFAFGAGGLACLALLVWGLRLGPDPPRRD